MGLVDRHIFLQQQTLTIGGPVQSVPVLVLDLEEGLERSVGVEGGQQEIGVPPIATIAVDDGRA